MRFAFVRNPSGMGWIASTGAWTAPVSTLLLFLTTALMLLMPITEHLADWDRFLRGGTDVEFTLLAGLLFTGLVLLAGTQHRSLALTQLCRARIPRGATRPPGGSTAGPACEPDTEAAGVRCRSLVLRI